MTDITELAQRLKLEVHRAVSNFNPQMNIKTRDLKELVEALEKAQQTEKTLESRNRRLDGIITAAEKRIAELENQLKAAENNEIDARCRIAELEESHAQVIHARDHYKRMSEEGLQQLAESRTVTVKLVDINEFLADVHDKTLALAFRRLAEGVREADIAALTAQGIKWEAE